MGFTHPNDGWVSDGPLDKHYRSFNWIETI